MRRLDDEAKIAGVEPVEVDYYTQPVLANSCRFGEISDQKTHGHGRMLHLHADVTWKTTAFRKIKYYTMELIGQGELDLPAQTMATMAMAWVVNQEIRGGVQRKGFNPIEALIGVRNLMLAALPSLAMCDRRDISGMVESSNLGEPTIIIYDRYIGGLGFAQTGYDLIDTWLDMCREIVTDCPCTGGCPSCVGLANLRPPIHGDPDLTRGYPAPNKDATIELLRLLSISDG